MKKGDIVSILDGVLRVFIVILTCYSMFSGKDIVWEIIILGIMISCFSLIYTYKKNIGRIGMSYFFSVFTEFVLIGLEFFTGIIGALINPLFPIIENDPEPGTGLLLLGYLFGFIIITAVERIVLGIIEVIRWYKGS